MSSANFDSSAMALRRPKVCRICRAPDNDDLISVQLVQDSISIARMVVDLTGIEVTADKNLPQNVCLACLERLGSAYKLRRQCIDTDQMLRKEFYTNAQIQDESKSMVKLEIETLDPDEEEEERVEAVEADDDSGEHCSADQQEIEMLDGSELKTILEEREPSDGPEEDTRTISARELISILAPEEKEQQQKPGVMYLNHYDESDFEVVQQFEHYEQIKFIVTRCCGCSERFQEKKQLFVHGQLVHKPNRKRPDKSQSHECPICFRQFSKLNEISFHRNHIDTDRYHCRECDLLLDSHKRMATHLQQIHSIEVSEEGQMESADYNEHDADATEHAPTLTLASFDPIQYKLIETDKEYDLVEFTWFRCCGCANFSESREDFERHSREVHFPERVEDERLPFECSICYQRFDKKASLSFHKNSPTKRRIACRMCKGIFRGESSYGKHMVHYHGIVATDEQEHNTPGTIEGMEIDFEVQQIDAIKQDISEVDPEESRSESVSMHEIEFIDDPSEDVDGYVQEYYDDDLESEEDELETPDNVPATERKSNKYLPTRQRKEMGRVPGSLISVVEQLDGYNIVEIAKERCCRCLAFFDSLDELNEHTKQHQEESLVEDACSDKPTKYQCEFCLKKFDIALVYVVHKRIREQKQFYQCRLCDFVIDSESRLKNHMLHNDQHAKYFNLIREDVSDRYDAVQLPGTRCCGCGRYFDNEASLVEHSRVAHARDSKRDSLKRTQACNACDKRFYNKSEVEAHQKKNGSTVRYYCKLCEFETPSEARMLKHLYSSIHNQALPSIEVKNVEVGFRKAGPLRYCCFSGCQLPFHDFKKMQDHIDHAHRQEKEANINTFGAHGESRLQCDCCFHVFRTVTLLRQHQFSQRETKSYVCAVCGEAKQNKTALTAHEMRHTGERPYSCSVCDKRFSSQTILNSHMKCHVPKQYQCNECGEKFARGENLKRHIRHRHSEATFCCSYCPRKLKTREAQVLHERSHTGEKPFECRSEGCDKRYASVTDRRRHEMASHTGERPHKCSYCLASFVRKRQMTIHERKHTGERPFVCNQCGKAFIDAPRLKKHTC